MTTSVMMFLLIGYMVLGLYIYHAMFDIWYLNFGKAMISEIFGAFLFGALMTGLTLKFSVPIMIIIIVIGIILSFKFNTPFKKIAVIAVFAFVGIIIAIAGNNYKKGEVEKEKQAEEEAENYSRFIVPSDYEGEFEYFVISEQTYSLKKGSNTIFMNAIKEENDKRYSLCFMELIGTTTENVGEIRVGVSEDDPYTYKDFNNSDNTLVVNNYDSLTLNMNIGGKDCSGTYILTTYEESERFYKLFEESDLEKEDTNYQENYEEDVNVEESTDEEVAEDSYEEETVADDTASLVGMGYSGDFTNPAGDSLIQMNTFEQPDSDGALGIVTIYQGDEFMVAAPYYLDTSGTSDWADWGYDRLYYFYDGEDIYYLGISSEGEGDVLDYNSPDRNIDMYSVCTG